MALTVLITLLVNLVFIQGRTEMESQPGFQLDDHTHLDVYASALSRAHYNPWACDYRIEPGYKCLSCHKALHCYPGNFALLVQCAGIFPFCRNGYCSRFKTDGCIEEPESNAASYTTLPSLLQVFHVDNKTTIVPDAPASHGTHTELNEPVPEESASNTITTELNVPNKISGGIVTSTDTSETANNIKKPKGSIRISEQINSL